MAAHMLVWDSFRQRGARLLCDEYCESLAKEVLTEHVVGYSLLLAQYFGRLCFSRYMQNGDLRVV